MLCRFKYSDAIMYARTSLHETQTIWRMCPGVLSVSGHFLFYQVLFSRFFKHEVRVLGIPEIVKDISKRNLDIVTQLSCFCNLAAMTSDL
jgi:hypothetical protein